MTSYQLALADCKPEIAYRRGVTLAPTRGVRMMITVKHAPKESRIMVTVR